MGFHKTASSSLQLTCKHNVKELDAQGILYPLFNCLTVKNQSSIDNHSIPIHSCFCDHPEQYHMNIRWNVQSLDKVNEHYLSYLGDCLSQDKDIIISGEDISGLPPSALQKIVQFIEKYNFVIKPIVCVRSPYAYHCSSIQERVKGGTFVDFGNFTSQKGKINKLSSLFGDDIQFVPFSLACKHSHGPVGYLLELMKVDLDLITIKASNEGTSNDYVRVQNILNKLEPRIIKGKLNPNFKYLNENGGENKFYLTTEEYSPSVQLENQQENTFFLKYLGKEFCDPNVQFSTESKLRDVFQHFPEILGVNLPDEYADTFRNMAIKLEKSALEDAYKLMHTAHAIRPNGPLISKKLAEYKRKLGIKCSY